MRKKSSIEHSHDQSHVPRVASENCTKLLNQEEGRGGGIPPRINNFYRVKRHPTQPNKHQNDKTNGLGKSCELDRVGAQMGRGIAPQTWLLAKI